MQVTAECEPLANISPQTLSGLGRNGAGCEALAARPRGGGEEEEGEYIRRAKEEVPDALSKIDRDISTSEEVLLELKKKYVRVIFVYALINI